MYFCFVKQEAPHRVPNEYVEFFATMWYLVGQQTAASLENGSFKQQLTHCGRVTQICVFTLKLCKTDDANLRFYRALGFHALYT